MVKRHGEFTSMVHFTPVDPCFPGPLKGESLGLHNMNKLQEIVAEGALIRLTSFCVGTSCRTKGDFLCYLCPDIKDLKRPALLFMALWRNQLKIFVTHLP